MTDKRMLIVDESTLVNIDENRGDMSRIEFINFLIDCQFQEEGSPRDSKEYVTRKEYLEFTGEIKDQVRRFLDYFISKGLKNNGNSDDGNFSELVQKLQSLSASKVKPKKAR